MEARGLLCSFGLLLIVDEQCFQPFVLVLTKSSSVVGVASLLVVSFCRFSLFNYSVILFLVFVLVLFCLFLLFVVLPVASPPGRVHESDARGGHDSDSPVGPGYNV